MMRSIEQSLIKIKSANDDPRIGSFVQHCTIKSLTRKTPGFVIIGFPDDEGIVANNGRSGAKRAPLAVRQQLFRFAQSNATNLPIYDVGDLKMSGELLYKHQQAHKASELIWASPHKLISIGGGNDYAYPNAKAYLEFYQKYNPILINIDAHLDLRPTHNGPTSGTPFYQIIEEFRKKKKMKFDFIEIGIQNHCNSSSHLHYAKKNRIPIFRLEDSVGRLKNIFTHLKLKNRPVFLCIDMDAFPSHESPGVSAPNPFGLSGHEVDQVLKSVFKKNYVCGIGLYEVSPRYDIDNKTSRLAALFAYTFLTSGEAK